MAWAGTLLLAGCAADHSVLVSGRHIEAREAEIPVQVVDGECDVPPRFLEGRSPIYPTLVRDHGILAGKAVVEFTVGKDGRASAPRVVEATHPQFAAGVAHVMRTWRFSPALRRGVAIDVVVTTSIAFTASGH